MRSLIFIIIWVLTILQVAGQSTNKGDISSELATEGMALIRGGEFEEGMKSLRLARRIEPHNIVYPILIGQVFFEKQMYDMVVVEMAPFVSGKKGNAQCFQLYGNALDMMGDPEGAIDIYKRGLKKYPMAGLLYMELGILEFGRKNDIDAAEHWEKGIEMVPLYASNYYWAAKYYAKTSERIRAILYAEMFINLERATPRTREISELLFQAYRKSLQLQEDGSIHVNFSEHALDEFHFMGRQALQVLPMESAFTWSWYLSHVESSDSINIAQLYKARQQFVGYWQDLFSKNYPLSLMFWHAELQSEGFFLAYTYWLFFDGHPEEFQAWFVLNKRYYKDFEDWFVDHPISLSLKGKLDSSLFSD